MTSLLPDIHVDQINEKKTIFDYLEEARNTGNLPSLGSVVVEFQSMTRKNNFRIDDVADLVKLDMGMSLRVLRMSNSSYFAPPEPITDVRAAILHIGLSTFRRTIVTASCIEMTSSVPKSTMDWKEFWLHAAGVGHLAMELSGRLKTKDLDAESFYLMGLLHDIGKVVMAHVQPVEFNKIYQLAAQAKQAPALIEMELLDVDHGFLGAWFLEKQGIPSAVREPIRIHHAPIEEESPEVNHARLLNLADQLARHFKLGQSGNHSEIADPFSSKEWNWYLENSRYSSNKGITLQDAVIEQVSRISDLVRKIIA